MDILGVSAVHEPSAACLVRDGRIVAAVQEARFTRRRADTSFPRNAIAFCLRAGKIGPAQLGGVAVTGSADTPVPRDEDNPPPPGSSSWGRRMKRLLGRPDTLRDLLGDELDRDVRVEGVEPELAHAAAAYLPSAFEQAAVLVVGGRGQPSYVARGTGGSVEVAETLLPDEGDPKEVAVRLAHGAQRVAPADALAIGGPGAGFRATNGRILAVGLFRHVWVQPAAAVGASALGAALILAHREGGQVRRPDRPDLGFGPGYNAAQIRTFLRSQRAAAEELERGETPERVARLLAEGCEVGWFDGRLDFGDETAGSRSVLRAPGAGGAPPPREGEVLVLPSGRADEFVAFEGECPPLVALPLRDEWKEQLGDPSDPDDPRAVVTVDRRDHRGLAALLAAVERTTGSPVLAARPLRPPGEPVACTPRDAWNTFSAVGVDAMALGDFLLSKSADGAVPVSTAEEATA
jgi:predicted NodU family carbamoyl transferase